MVERGCGRLVLFGSEDAERPHPNSLPYCAAKHGIPVNAVSPALTATPVADTMMEKRAKQKGSSFEDAVESFLEEKRPTLEL